METNGEAVVKTDKKTVAKPQVHYNKCNVGRGYKYIKLLYCLTLISLLFAFGCRQKNGGEEQKIVPPPPSSGDITITVKCDDGLIVKTPATFTAKKNATWQEIKKATKEKITEKGGFAIKEWRLNDVNGTLLKDTDKFEKDETVFAVSQKKTETAKYKVEHYQENIQNEEYTKVEKDTEENTGEVGKDTEAVAKRYEGFTLEPFNQVKITKDGNTVVRINYKRNRVSLILDLAGGTTTTKLKDGENGKKLLEGKFEAEVEVKELSKVNHTFSRWEPGLPQTFPSSNSTQVYTAMWTSKPNNPTGGDELTYTLGSIRFKMKKIKEVTDAVLGDNAQDDNKEHKVSLSSYYMGETEVTQGLWQAVMGNNPSRFKDSVKNPVEEVSWFDCVSFCNKLTEKVMSKEDCVYTINGNSVQADFSKKGFRLPTEAEWEYVAMGGNRDKYAGCNEENELESYAWYKANSENKTHEVGKKQANRYGLYDMSGNVWEWCWDWYSESTPSGGKDPTGAVSGSSRVIRGGSWLNDASICECAYRVSYDPSGSYGDMGLRLACRP